MAAIPHGGREGEAEERACVGYLGADGTPQTAKTRCRCVLGSDNGARGDSQGVGGGWDTVDSERMETKFTALQLAVFQGKLDAIRLLAQCGANVDTPTDDDDGNKAALNDQVDVDGNWERICQPRLSRLEQVCSS